MTRTPDFDDLVGTELDLEEHDRLLRVHELLVAAGPPPELPPQLERGPTLAMTMARRAPQGRARRRVMLLAAAIVVVALAFLGGYISGNGGGNGVAGGRCSALRARLPRRRRSRRCASSRADAAGNWPMRISTTGLPKLPAHGYYEVYLWRNGKTYAPCGTFVVGGADRAITWSSTRRTG